jgi:hypothetical protein
MARIVAVEGEFGEDGVVPAGAVGGGRGVRWPARR